MHRPRRWLVLAVLLAAVLPSGVPAQVRYLVDEPGTWKPWRFTAIESARRERRAAVAEVKAFEDQLLALNAILQRATGVAAPRGFSVETWGNLDGYAAPESGEPAGASVPLAGGLTFGAFAIHQIERDGRPVTSDTGETALLRFAVNGISGSTLGGDPVPDWVGSGAEAFLEPPAAGDVAGFPRHGDVLVIKINPKPIWAPVPMARAIELQGASRRHELAGLRESVGQIRTSLADLEDPAKRAERFAGFRAVAASMPDPAEFLAQMELTENDVADGYRRELSPDGGGAMQELLAIEGAIADAEAWVAELSATERMAPSCFAASGASPRQRIKAGPAAGCVPIVQPDWTFFQASLPRSAPQVIVIPQISRCFDDQPVTPPNPAGCAANRQLLLTLDRGAVLNWLK